MSTAGISINFAPQIAAFAKANDLDLDQERAESLNATLQSLMQLEGSHVSFPIGEDRTGTIEDALAVYSEGTPRKAKVSSASGGMNATERAVAMNKALRAAKTESKAAEAVELVRRHGNPWKTGNVTHRHFIQNVNPTLADQLRNSAGK